MKLSAISRDFRFSYINSAIVCSIYNASFKNNQGTRMEIQDADASSLIADVGKGRAKLR